MRMQMIPHICGVASNFWKIAWVAVIMFLLTGIGHNDLVMKKNPFIANCATDWELFPVNISDYQSMERWEASLAFLPSYIYF